MMAGVAWAHTKACLPYINGCSHHGHVQQLARARDELPVGTAVVALRLGARVQRDELRACGQSVRQAWGSAQRSANGDAAWRSWAHLHAGACTPMLVEAHPHLSPRLAGDPGGVDVVAGLERLEHCKGLLSTP